MKESDWELNEISKEFVIYPPFYQTNWFYFLILISIGSLIYFFFKIRVLTYNRDIVRELLRMLLKKIKPKSSFFIVKVQGLDVKVNSDEVLYVKSDGNYLEIYTLLKRYVIRCKIGEFLSLVPDKLEYLRVSRTYIIRIDKIQSKNSKTVKVNNHEIVVGKTYQKGINDLTF